MSCCAHKVSVIKLLTSERYPTVTSSSFLANSSTEILWACSWMICSCSFSLLLISCRKSFRKTKENRLKKIFFEDASCLLFTNNMFVLIFSVCVTDFQFCWNFFQCLKCSFVPGLFSLDFSSIVLCCRENKGTSTVFGLCLGDLPICFN